MRNFNNKSGFTLIEIIVVLIIVGILAAIALPNLFSNVAKAQAGEAIAALGAVKSEVAGCVMGHPDNEFNDCSGTSANFGSTANFTYSFGVALSNSGTAGLDNPGPYTLVAVNKATAADVVTLTYSSGNGSFTCSGASLYAGVC